MQPPDRKTNKIGHAVLLLIILISGAIFRFRGLDWDGYKHYNPDELYISWVGTTIEIPTDLHTAFSPAQSTFNPFYWPPEAESKGIQVEQDQTRKFAYGHLPLYLGVLSTRLIEKISPYLIPVMPSEWKLTSDILNGAGRIEYHHLTAVGRGITALVDTATIFLVYLIGCRVFGKIVGLLGAAFLSVTVMNIQIAHFFIVDSYLTFFATCALFFLITAIQGRGKISPWASAIFIGLAMGSKIIGGILIIPLAFYFLYFQNLPRRKRILGFLLAVFIIGITFAITNPFSLLDWSCRAVTPKFSIVGIKIPSIDWRSCLLANLFEQSKMVRGSIAFPFTRQYDHTAPYLYHIENLIRWGMGPFLGVAAIAGLCWMIFRAFRRQTGPTELLTLSWVIPYFLLLGGTHTKFMRYMLPITPFLAIYAAALLWRIKHSLGRTLLSGGVLAATGLYALAFTSIYSQQHPWITAQQWLKDNAPASKVIVGEKWDTPLLAKRLDAKIDWLGQSGSEDDLVKIVNYLTTLAEADYLTINSNRVYGVVARMPENYPLSSQFHQLLFDGSLGYELVFVTGRAPHLGSLDLWPERFLQSNLIPPKEVSAYLEANSYLTFGRADESFTVYDQPLAMIFFNSGLLTVEQMLVEFDLSGN